MDLKAQCVLMMQVGKNNVSEQKRMQFLFHLMTILIQRLHSSAKLNAPFSVMASTRIYLLSILYFSGVLRILKEVAKYCFWTALKPSTTSF